MLSTVFLSDIMRKDYINILYQKLKICTQNFVNFSGRLLFPLQTSGSHPRTERLPGF